MPEPAVNLWSEPEHALSYLRVADTIPHRTEGEAELLQVLPDPLEDVLDLGTGDGRLLALVLAARPGARAVGLDFSTTMIDAASARFADVPTVSIRAHDLDRSLHQAPIDADRGYDAVVSSFAIHHVGDERKRALYAEVAEVVRPGGCFLNLEHVASATERLHVEFLARLGIDPADDDPSNKLAPVDTQLGWLRDAGFVDVDCLWKWRELALLTGRKP